MPETTNHVGGKGEGAGSGPQTTPPAPTKPIQWRKAEPRQSFCDGDQILVACPYTNRHSGKTTYEYSILTVSCDSENFGFDCYGSSWDGEWEEVEWWIPLSEFRVPTLMVDAAPLVPATDLTSLRERLAEADDNMRRIAIYHNGCDWPLPPDSPPLYIINRSTMGEYEDRIKSLETSLATARAEVHRLRKCLDVAQMAMVAVVQYADSLGPCEVRDRLLEIAKTRPATAADRPEQQARLTQLSETPTPTKGT